MPLLEKSLCHNKDPVQPKKNHVGHQWTGRTPCDCWEARGFLQVHGLTSVGAGQHGLPFSRHSQLHRLRPEVRAGLKPRWCWVTTEMGMCSRNCWWGLTMGFKLGKEKGESVKGLRDTKTWQNQVHGHWRVWADHLQEISQKNTWNWDYEAVEWWRGLG